MRQTLAIFYDAYRELNSRRMFWITLVLSVLLIIVLAMFGVDARGIRFLKWRFDQPHAGVATPEVTTDLLLKLVQRLDGVPSRRAIAGEKGRRRSRRVALHRERER